MRRIALGLGLGALFRRARDLALRPARHELADARAEIAALRADLARLGAAVRAVESYASEAGTAARLQAALDTVVAADRARLSALETAGVRRSAQLALLERLIVGAASPAPAPAEQPLVSIVMPTRNRAALVCEAIESVLGQQYGHWELIVVDDGSEDGTAQALSRFLHDPRIRLERIEPRGVSGARNHALALARGSLVAYLDSDNLWYPGFLSAAVAALAADPAQGFVYGTLASEVLRPDGLHLLLETFDRARLECANFIDLNTVVHRRELYERHGGFDESLQRAVDWDLALRYTAQQPALALPVLAVRYRICDAIRITDTVPIGPSWLAIRRNIDPPPVPARQPRVLYVIWHYPQLSETYVEGEIRCLLRWGAEIAVWRETAPVSPYEAPVPVFDGDLAEAIRRFRPDVLHVHWLFYALGQGDAIAATGLPVTLRMHGFDATAWQLKELLEKPWLHRIYAFPRQLQLLPGADPRVLPIRSGFDTSYFRPAPGKDPRLVVRTSASLASKDIPLFFELAKRLPGHRFVFAGVTCNEHETMPRQLRELRERMQSPVELRFDVPRAEVAELVGRAGIFLHTIHSPDAPDGAPIGMPMSIAEAMATGAWVLVRDEPELVEYVGDAGAVYSNADEAVALIESSTLWSETRWQSVRVRASDRAYLYHADELVFRPIYSDWCELARTRAREPVDARDLARPA